MEISVRKRDGRIESFDANKINLAIEHAAEGLGDEAALASQIASELSLTLFDGITTQQLDEAAIQVALQNIKDDPIFDKIATRLLLKTIYKKALGHFTSPQEVKRLHREGFKAYILRGVDEKLLDERLLNFDLDRLADALDPARDDLFKYIGLTTLNNRYGIRGRNGDTFETPQFFWMRVSMGLTLNETDELRTDTAIEFYNKQSKLEYLAAGSTLVNAGTPHNTLSNCFVVNTEDDMEAIMKTMRDVAWITKGTGGIGLSLSKLRAQGAPIHSNNTTSTGPVPFIHTLDSILRAVSRGGKKFGAMCIYIDDWHLDIPEFIDLKQNSGDPYRRARTANTAVWISDEFMKRVLADDYWYRFDPLEVMDLTELYGSAFSKRYNEYVAMAERGEIKLFKKVKAKEQYIDMLVALQTTSHPWLTWKDSINNRALNNNTGIIHSSNLCLEITLPQDKDNIAVCNLASINLSTHLVDGKIDYDLLTETTKVAIRHLDNLIDITRSNVPEADYSNKMNRAVGLGYMGFTDILERMGISYGSDKAAQVVDEITEHISFAAIEESIALAKERGVYPNFEGSGWSKGLVPYDTIQSMEDDRGVEVDVSRGIRLDWDRLRGEVRGGIRNATLLAIAPTASIGLVAGTTPGLDPQFAQIFSRATSNGKFLEINNNLVNDLKKLGIWEDVKVDLLRNQGDIQGIEGIPNALKDVYLTSFQLSPYAFLRIAANAQKWVDQAISRNIYLEDRDVENMATLYMQAWLEGVKTTYYLHMKPRHTAEQSVVQLNKRTDQQSGSDPIRKGFGFKN